jgi:hypothetical protein
MLPNFIRLTGRVKPFGIYRIGLCTSLHQMFVPRLAFLLLTPPLQSGEAERAWSPHPRTVLTVSPGWTPALWKPLKRFTGRGRVSSPRSEEAGLIRRNLTRTSSPTAISLESSA